MYSLFGTQPSPFSAANPRPAGKSNGAVDQQGNHLTIGHLANGNPFATSQQVSNTGTPQDMVALQQYMQAMGITGTPQEYFKRILKQQGKLPQDEQQTEE